MPRATEIFKTVPDDLVKLLTAHLPFSLVLLRVLQHTSKFDGAHTDNTRIVFTSPETVLTASCSNDVAFTVAYIDMGGGPDTQMYIYSTWENGGSQVDEDEFGTELADIVKAVVGIRKEFNGELSYPGSVLLGALNSSTRAVLERLGRVTPRPTGLYDKWLFRLEELPNKDTPLPDGMRWDIATLDDCKLAVLRNNLPRPPHKIVHWKNLVIKLDDGTPVAWAFLGPDASLCSLHCEEPYRGKGLAKMLASKLIRQHTNLWGNDGWSMADVGLDNMASRGVCKSLNGKPKWTVSWVLFHVEEDPQNA